MKIIPEPKEYQCSKCHTNVINRRVEGRLVLAMCLNCAHEGIIDILPEPEPDYPIEARCHMVKDWANKKIQEF